MSEKRPRAPRERFATHIGFILAAAGSAIGLGNIWRFPWMVGENGGAAFLFIYLLIMGVFALPMLLNEVLLGRASQRNMVGGLKKLAPGTQWHWAGLLGLSAAIILLSYYSVIAGWTLGYTFRMCTGACRDMTAAQIGESFGEFISNPWKCGILQIITLVTTAIIVSRGIAEGVEKYCKYLLPILFLLLVALAVRSITMPGGFEGLIFYLKPDMSKLSPRIVFDALGMAVFSVSIGMGSQWIYASYVGREKDMPRGTFAIVSLDTLVAVLAGLVVFPALFAAGLEPNQGPGLTFVTLPIVFNTMPGGWFFSAVFFSLLYVAAITSTIAMLETSASYFIDEKGWSRPKSVWILTGVIFLLGGLSLLSFGPWSEFHLVKGKTFFDIFDFYVGSFAMPLGALLIAIFTGWCWGTAGAIEEARLEGATFPMSRTWAFIIRWVAPLVLGAIFIVGLLPIFKPV